MTEPEAPTAALVLIGNELLSGKTQDANLQFIGTELGALGIRLMEARVVRDEHDAIAAHVNELRACYTYVFTTGGIGPTHDDITAEAVARAFGAELELNAEAVARLEQGQAELNEARLRMARVPAGAVLIDNPLSIAPGFRIENVFVLAGVPSIARSMFGALASQLTPGIAIRSTTIDVLAREGDFAHVLTRIAGQYPGVEIGSYPFSREGRFCASLVVRGTDAAQIDAAVTEIVRAMDALGADPVVRD